MHFDILNHLGVAYDCEGQTDGRTHRRTETLLAIARSSENWNHITVTMQERILSQVYCVPLKLRPYGRIEMCVLSLLLG